MSYYTRIMREEDIPQALAIDREAFPTQWPHPTYNSLKHELHNRMARYIVACKRDGEEEKSPDQNGDKSFWDKLPLHNLISSFGRPRAASISKTNELVVGYAGFWIMVDEAHVTTIGVRGNCRRQGLGELLMFSCIHLALRLSASLVTLEVRVSNVTAQALYQKLGFTVKGTRRRYYSDNGEDAYIMSTDAVASDSFKNKLTELEAYHQLKWHRSLNYTFCTGS